VQFLGRDGYLSKLHAEFQIDKPSLVVVYGRRRVGKSALLQQASTPDSPYIYFQATKVEQGLNIAAFKADIERIIGGDAVLSGLSDWFGILTWLAKAAESHPKLVVVLDEFPYLTDQTDALPSIIQKIWDSGVMKAGNLKLVLCGSLISYMEELLTERNPLFGRRTMALQVEAMPLKEAALFLPHYSAIDKITAYAIFGGVPHYLQACNPEMSLRDNVIRLLMSSSGLLYDEPEFLLQSELRETKRYSSIVSAIATGANKLSEVVGRVSGLKDTAQISPYVETLIKMRILEKQRSFGSSLRERDARYVICDPIFKFWHRFIRPNLSALTRGFGDNVYDTVITPQLSDYMGLAFEEMCREHLRLFSQIRLSAPAQEIGKLWSGHYDLDIMGKLLDGTWVFGECKWQSQHISVDVLEHLQHSADSAVQATQIASKYFTLFSKTGFTPELKKYAEINPQIVLYELDELV
jgi:uncharacterized protein